MAVKFGQTGPGLYELDVRGFSCPHPQVYTKKALQKMASGEVLKLVFDNPSSGESIALMCENEGNDLYEQHDGNGSFEWMIRKG
ncbi:MAG: sulfurtransferase TusA family protein [Thiotrichales bacterium]